MFEDSAALIGAILLGTGLDPFFTDGDSYTVGAMDAPIQGGAETVDARVLIDTQAQVTCIGYLPGVQLLGGEHRGDSARERAKADQKDVASRSRCHP